MAVDPDRVLARPPGAAGPVAVAEPFLGFGIDTDHRLLVIEEGGGRGVQMGELGIAVRMVGAFGGLDGALQAVTQAVQQAPDGRGADPMSL